MKTKLFRLVVFVVLTGSGFGAIGQEFSIIKVELNHQNIHVYYDLLDSVAGNSYSLYLYGSADNFVTPLAKTEGDVGLQVKPGKNRKITWKAMDELGPDFDGKIGLEIRGKLFVPFISLKNFSSYKTFKRTETYTLTWSGGAVRNILNFDLYRGDKLAHTFAGISNLGHFDFTIPKKVKPGKYHFKVSDSKNKDEVIYTDEFLIKRKIPLLAKAASILLIGAAVPFLLPKEEEIIPDPSVPKK